MIMRRIGFYGLLAALTVVVGCVPPREPAPTPPPTQEPPPPPPPLPEPPPAAADWRDLPLTPGEWTYRNEGGSSIALFGPSPSEAQFAVRCDLQRRQVILSRAGETSGNAMTVRTSFGARNLPLSPVPGPLPEAGATVQPRDRLLDEMAFSRGRYTVEVPGRPMLVIPAWPEPSRVIEDCRG